MICHSVLPKITFKALRPPRRGRESLQSHFVFQPVSGEVEKLLWYIGHGLTVSLPFQAEAQGKPPDGNRQFALEFDVAEDRTYHC